jgi:CTP:molybdopterin cytidylyltransferase MocA
MVGEAVRPQVATVESARCRMGTSTSAPGSGRDPARRGRKDCILTADGLLLAAGAGTRMGLPKALMQDDDGTWWLRRAVTALRDGGCSNVVVVLGAKADDAREILDGIDVGVVVALGWEIGLAASLRTGLQSLDSRADAALVSLVDLPDVDAAVVRRVFIRATGPDVLARATYRGRPGHPVLLGRDHWPAVIETTTGDEGAKGYLAAHHPTLVECGDLAGGRDVDTPR